MVHIRSASNRQKAANTTVSSLAIIAALVLENSAMTPAFAANMTGTYVGIADARAVIAQLVQTPDGKVTGRYEEFDLSPDGKLLDVNAAISGAASDDTIAVTFTPS